MVGLAEEFKGSSVELAARFPDFTKDLLRLFNQRQVRYLVVGGYAEMKYTEPFYTKDMDIWVEPVADNAKRAYAAPVAFGAPMADLTVDDLTQPHIVFQFRYGSGPRDVMTTIDAVTFIEAWKNRVETHLSGIPISIISLQDLIRNKEAASRDTDQLHLKRLRSYGE